MPVTMRRSLQDHKKLEEERALLAEVLTTLQFVIALFTLTSLVVVRVGRVPLDCLLDCDDNIIVM